ncbi:2-dehydropantoate 2-reductase [Alphaproteobacteria bacterium]|nr:2-dehydropantoate 2-reductase [Alphaproteobacteria bacterium]
MKKILVIGSGAIGCFFASKIAKETDLTMLWRNDYQHVIDHGIKIISDKSETVFFPKIINNLKQYQEQCDYAIIATKVLPSINLIEIIKELKYLPKNIVLIQNGIHIEKEIYKNFPQCSLISALAFIAVSKVSCGIFEHFAYGRLTLGNFPTGLNQDCLDLITLFKTNNIEAKASEKIEEDRWKKLIWNASFNPISVLTGGSDTKKLLDNKNCKELLQKIMKEIIELSCQDGYNLNSDLINKNIEDTLQMRPYKTSMLLDFEAHRPMEVEAIVGNALNFAKSKSIPTPYLSTIYALLSCY